MRHGKTCSLGRGGGGGGGGARGGFTGGRGIVTGAGSLRPIYPPPNIQSGFCGPEAVVGSDGTCQPVAPALQGRKRV